MDELRGGTLKVQEFPRSLGLSGVVAAAQLLEFKKKLVEGWFYASYQATPGLGKPASYIFIG